MKVRKTVGCIKDGVDCTKEEALKLKGMAEQMIKNEEYWGARAKLEEAKHLFPSLEHVCQMLTICNVLCAADIDFPIYGMDWYFILQLSHEDDEEKIRGAHQELSLHLEPIKDEFPGTESAMKFMDEALSVLCDGAKRSIFDAQRKASRKSSERAHSRTSSHGINKYIEGESSTFWSERLGHFDDDYLPMIVTMKDLNSSEEVPRKKEGDQLGVKHGQVLQKGRNERLKLLQNPENLKK
ncbi:uncharacterized protein LOC143862235 [Tasmannia lanceolata]|uniref:uncharacterized protein LOC143862235 n=1 Tax=Tasmannia lanceolata TaxID=3420 RepID=UPI004063637B